MWFLEYLFEPDKQLDAFEQAVARAKQYIDDPDYKAKVVVMIPYPIPSTTDFGDPFGTGTSLSFARFPQGDEAQFQARFGAIKAYLAELDRRWNEKSYEHLEFVGLYWLAEAIDTSSDYRLLQEVSKLVEARGQTFLWIPYFSAAGWSQWKDAGFDAAIYQPNYMFNTNIPLSRFEEAATREALRHGCGDRSRRHGVDVSFGQRAVPGVPSSRCRVRLYDRGPARILPGRRRLDARLHIERSRG